MASLTLAAIVAAWAAVFTIVSGVAMARAGRAFGPKARAALPPAPDRTDATDRKSVV
jgi:hypothetical protein